MNFDNEKKQCLLKLDKSKKGNIDEQILPLINLINKHPDFYSTSSCAGRIMLIKPSKIKHDAEWLFSSHDIIEYSDLEPYLDKLPQETIYLRMEPPIIHIVARNLDSGDTLLKTANNAGFRRSCILSIKKRIVIEIMIPEKLDAPIAENNTLLVTEDYLKILIREANERLEKTRKKIKKIIKLFPQ